MQAFAGFVVGISHRRTLRHIQLMIGLALFKLTHYRFLMRVDSDSALIHLLSSWAPELPHAPCLAMKKWEVFTNKDPDKIYVTGIYPDKSIPGQSDVVITGYVTGNAVRDLASNAALIVGEVLSHPSRPASLVLYSREENGAAAIVPAHPNFDPEMVRPDAFTPKELTVRPEASPPVRMPAREPARPPSAPSSATPAPPGPVPSGEVPLSVSPLSLFKWIFLTVVALTIGSLALDIGLSIFWPTPNTTQQAILSALLPVWTLGTGAIFGLLGGKAS
jgi:uncharacterized membrane protein (Fun14 family)